MVRDTLRCAMVFVILACAAGAEASSSQDGTAATAEAERRQFEAEVAAQQREEAAQEAAREAPSARDEQPGAPAPLPSPFDGETDGAATLTVAFPGGTVGQYVELLRKYSLERGAEANVMLKEDAGRLVLPAMDLKNVSLSSALQILHGYDAHSAAGQARLDIDRVLAGAGRPIYVIAARGLNSAGPQEQVVHVWNVSHLLSSGVKADDLLTAIEVALELASNESEVAAIKFHEATGLIMARGSRTQVVTIEQVIDQLGATAARLDHEQARKMELERAQQALMGAADMERQLAETQSNQAAMEMQRAAIEHEMQAARERHEHIINEQQKRLLELEMMLNERTAQLQGLQRQNMRGKSGTEE